MEISVDLVIIGAGTAGISAFREASKVTKNIVIIDHGPLGTTCARVGCMPSKVLLQVADSFHERKYFSKQGIEGSDKLAIDIKKVMKHVRQLRDYFTSGTVKYLESLGDSFISGKAEIIEPNIITVNQKKIITRSIIIATGSTSIIPEEWKLYSPDVLTSEIIFEQESFQKKVAVIGAGAIGLEIGQALSRLGIEIAAFHSHEFIAKLSDPMVNEAAISIMREEFSMYTGSRAIIENKNEGLLVKNDKQAFSAEQILATLGKKSNITGLGLEKLGIALNESGIPSYDRTTMQVGNLPIFIAGDVDHDKPLLHEAADEGRIAGYNAVRQEVHSFQRRIPLMIVFTKPNIAIVGQSYHSLQGKDYITGSINFNDQGRSRILFQNKGLLHIYANRESGKLLGAEMIAPAGEHLAHMLALAIQQEMTIFDLLRIPFYHPVIEEGVRTALQDLAKQVSNKHKSFDVVMRDSGSVSNLF